MCVRCVNRVSELAGSKDCAILVPLLRRLKEQALISVGHVTLSAAHTTRGD